MTLKGQYMKRNQMGDFKLAYEEQLSTFIFPFLKNTLAVYMENTLTSRKNIKIENISVINGTTFKKVRFSLSILHLFG
jgi:hypothetical protein